MDEARGRGETLGPLAGVPLALKDVFATRGVPTTCGSKILEGWLPPYNATVVERLQSKLRPVFGASSAHETLLITGSGTAAMEMAISSAILGA